MIIGLYGGTQATTMVEATPPQIRCTAVALGYNACVGVIGGFTPLVAAWLVGRTADELAPAYLIMVAARSHSWPRGALKKRIDAARRTGITNLIRSHLKFDRVRLRGPSVAQFAFRLAAIAENARSSPKLILLPPPAEERVSRN